MPTDPTPSLQRTVELHDELKQITQAYNTATQPLRERIYRQLMDRTKTLIHTRRPTAAELEQNTELLWEIRTILEISVHERLKAPTTLLLNWLLAIDAITMAADPGLAQYELDVRLELTLCLRQSQDPSDDLTDKIRNTMRVMSLITTDEIHP